MDSNIPPFLLEKPAAPAISGRGGRLRTPYVDKGIHHIASVIKTAYVQWETASGRGLFQSLDARVKTLFLALFLLIVTMRRGLEVQLMVAGFAFVLAALSRLDLLSFYRRVLFFGFVFGFLLAFPSSVNIITNGTVVVPLLSLSGAHDFWIYHIPKDIGLTREGLRGVAVLTLRVVNCLTLSSLVLYTTPFSEIMRSMKVFRVPDAFIVIINLTYKYIFIFARTVEDMHLAKKSRLAGAADDAEARRWIAGRISLIFRRTQLRCEEIYKAMLARGFSGEMVLQGFGRLKSRDAAAGALFAVAAILLMAI